MKLLSLPNLLSLSRLPLAGAFLLVTSTLGRAIIVVLVAATDMADGYFARRSPSHDRRAGAIIDPVTDKLFVLLTIMTFAINRTLGVSALLIVLSRDIFTTFAFFILKAMHSKIPFKSRMTGKVVTVLQLAVLLALLFWSAAVMPLIYVVGFASVVAIVDYSVVALRERRRLARRGATV
jgi:phosphatidylglycerophosphate synthase